MDYLFDGNVRLNPPHFSASSTQQVFDIGKKASTFLSASKSFLLDSKTTDSWLNYRGGWKPEKGDKADGRMWIGVDLLVPHKLRQIITRGIEPVEIRGDKKYDESWVANFTLKEAHAGEGTIASAALMDGITFPANTNANGIVTTHLDPAKDKTLDNIRSLRLHPMGENVGLRWELVGCSKIPRNKYDFVLEDMKNDALGITNKSKDYRLGARQRDMWHADVCAGQQFEIRLTELYLIKTIIVGGHHNVSASGVIKQFRILYSKTGSSQHFKW